MANPASQILTGIVLSDTLTQAFENKNKEVKKPSKNWSEVSSMNLCTADALATKGYNLTFLASYLCQWKYNAIWTPEGQKNLESPFLAEAIEKLKNYIIQDKEDDLLLLKTKEIENHTSDESLVRMLPLLFYIKGMPIHQQYISIREVSALTHQHSRAAMASLIYLKVAEFILNGEDKIVAYEMMQNEIKELFRVIGYSESKFFENIIQNPIYNLEKEKLLLDGSVHKTLEAALWSFYQNDSYLKVVFETLQLPNSSVNTNVLAAGLASLSYGLADVPQDWILNIARIQEIQSLGNRLMSKF